MTAKDKFLFEQKCRTCLFRPGQHNIFETANYIRIELLYLTNLEIRKYDKLPVSICDDCLNELRKACAFKKKCQESYYALIEEYENHHYKNDDLHIDNTIIKQEIISPKIEIEYSESISIKYEENECSDTIDDHEDFGALLEPQIIVQEQIDSLDEKSHDFFDNDYKINFEEIPEQCETNDEMSTESNFKTNKRNSPKKRCKQSKEKYECPVCGKDFVRAQNLKAHMPLHTGVKDFHCDQCDKAYTTLDHLKRHKKIHENDTKESPKKISNQSESIPKDPRRKYKCLQCDKSYFRAAHLKRHAQSHKIQLEFKCTMCEKSFALESHLVIHLQIHSGEKSHKCDICGLIFRSTPSLESHKLNHMVTLPGYQFANQT